MTVCPNCNCQNEAGATFCDQCGAHLTAAANGVAALGGAVATAGENVCPVCGAVAMSGDAFCNECGASLDAPSQPAPQPALQAAPQVAPQPSHVQPLPAAAVQIAPAPAPVPLIGQRAQIIIGNGQQVTLTGKASYLIGREDPMSGIFPEIDTTPSDGDVAGVSRRHAEIVHQNDQWFLEDLNSTNGTFVNNQRLSPHTRHPLISGDQIRLGRWVATFAIGPQQ